MTDTLGTEAMHIARALAAIRDAEVAAGRDAGSVRLLAVSKTRTAAEIRSAYADGLRDFGENYVQEATVKLDALADLDITWHFIGAIQSNKTSTIARRFDWVHSVDRERVARRLNDAATRSLNVCIQVNVDAEPQKAGVRAENVAPLVERIAELPRLRLRGLMVIPALDNPRAAFQRTRRLFSQLAPLAGDDWDTLSMGMSGDFPDAVAQGATLVRLGTAIFGPRPSN